MRGKQARAFIVIASAVLSLLLFLKLSHDPFLRGTDAYYYALQSDFWFRTGKVKIPDSSFIHRLLGCLQYLGIGAENALRLWTSIALFIVSSLVGLGIMSAGSPAFGTGALVWLFLSPSILFDAIEFPKQFALAIALSLLPILLRAPARQLRFLLPLWGLFALWLHRSAGLYLGLSAVFFGALRFRGSRPAMPWRKIGAVSSVGACSLFVYFFFVGDHLRLPDILRVHVGFWMPGIVSLALREALPLPIRVELFLSGLVGLFLIGRASAASGVSPVRRAVQLGLLVAGFCPCFGSEVFSFGERFAVFLPLTVWIAASLDPPSVMPRPMMAGAIAVSWAVSSLFRLEIAHPVAISPKYAEFQKMVDELNPKNIPMLIVHQGFNFFYKFKTTHESFSYEPEPHWDKTRVWRLIYGLSASEIHYFLPPGCGWESGWVSRMSVDPYYLMREDCYARFREGIHKDENPDLFALLNETPMNPSAKRPIFLYAKHQDDEPGDEFPAVKRGAGRGQ